MNQQSEWTEVKEISVASRLWATVEKSKPDSRLIKLVQGWEQLRLKDEVEWSLAILQSGLAYERRGERYVATFDGFGSGELSGAILSHTHVRGLPPSMGDIALLLELPVLSQFRVARFGLPSIVLRRQILVDRVDCAMAMRQVRLRAVQMAGLGADSEAMSVSCWTELKNSFARLRIEWNEETQ